MVGQAAHPLKYRPEIDGLRALAVVPVVLFHAGVPGFGGGYIGVDIFFVISGFLITSIIVRGLEDGQFSILGFYERRIRRILPALIGMAAAITPVAIIVFTPQQLVQYGRSLAATALFSSNFFFATQTGYFDAPAHTKPLLHTWSLGVEEQFYVVWPLLLLAAYKFRLSRKVIAFLFLAVAVGSLAVAQVQSTGALSAKYFFLPQSRAWELLLGAILALRVVPTLSSRPVRDVLGIAGICLIAFSITMFSSQTPFPSLWTLIPCLGAALFIYASDGSDGIPARVLSLQPLVFIGLISYSLYLWHWPVLVFMNMLVSEPASPLLVAGALVFSFALAVASYYGIERPFRTRASQSAISYRAIGAGASAIVLTAVVGTAISASKGLPQRLDAETLRFYQAANAVNPLRDPCLTSAETPAPASRCVSPKPARSGQYDILVWGDSHADAMFPAIAKLAELLGHSARQVSKHGCPPVLGAERRNGRRDLDETLSCFQFNNAVAKSLTEGPPLKIVVLVARWSRHTKNSLYIVGRDSKPARGAGSENVLEEALSQTVSKLERMGIPVLLVGQAPEFDRNPNDCFVQKRLLRQSTVACVTLDRKSVAQQLAQSEEILSRVAAKFDNAKEFRLQDFFCESELCVASRNGYPLYKDTTHMGLYGAQMVGALLAGKKYRYLFSALPTTAAGEVDAQKNSTVRR